MEASGPPTEVLAGKGWPESQAPTTPALARARATATQRRFIKWTSAGDYSHPDLRRRRVRDEAIQYALSRRNLSKRYAGGNFQSYRQCRHSQLSDYPAWAGAIRARSGGSDAEVCAALGAPSPAKRS